MSSGVSMMFVWVCGQGVAAYLSQRQSRVRVGVRSRCI